MVIMEILNKLSTIQVKLKAPKNLKNSFGGYMYRNAEGILEAVKPYLKETNTSLIVEDDIISIGERVYVKATATLYDNDTGENKSASAFAREPLTKKGSDESQITGASSSYARKYALNGLFLLDDTKDPDTDEDTARRKGESAEGMRAQQEDEKLTAETADKPIDATKWKALQSTLKKNGVDPKDMMKHYGYEKATDITEGMFRLIVNEDMKELVEKYGSESKAD